MKAQPKVLLDSLILLANSKELLKKLRYNEKGFTRNRKLLFKKLLFFMLNTVNKSNEVALVKYFVKSLSVNDFKELYFKRWAVEITCDVIKNKLGWKTSPDYYLTVLDKVCNYDCCKPCCCHQI